MREVILSIALMMCAEAIVGISSKAKVLIIVPDDRPPDRIFAKAVMTNNRTAGNRINITIAEMKSAVDAVIPRASARCSGTHVRIALETDYSDRTS